MNLNSNAHFSQYPTIEIQRSQFDRTHSVKLAFDAGKLIPFDVDEVLPGDTFSIDTTAVARMTTPLFPVMGDAYLDIYYFFVPQRLVWKHSEEFYGANNEGAWYQPTEYFIPCVPGYLTSNILGHDKVSDYMGIPPATRNMDINCLPFRAYGLIWNDWFRNENLEMPILINIGDTEDFPQTGIPDYYNLLPVQKERDYFTSCLPAPQKGNAVSIPLLGMAPLTTGNTYQTGWIVTGTGSPSSDHVYLSVDDSGYLVKAVDPDGSTPAETIKVQSLNLYADLASTTSFDVNDIRTAFQVQRILERDARYGTRFNEYLKAAFGVDSPDARLQRPEYLGGHRISIGVQQVVQQSPTSDSPLGNAGAISKTVFGDDSFTHSFVEPGYLIGVCCVRYKHNYQNGLERLWSRKRRFDFYDPALAHIGEQPVYTREIYSNLADNRKDDIFGYQEAFAEYRYKPSRVTSAFRSDYPDGSLSSWVYVDNYTQQPYLSAGWSREDPSVIDNTLAVTGDGVKQFFADICIRNYSTRPMPTYSIPGLIDHF